MAEVGLTPFHRRDLSLAGFVLQGRWPEGMREWAQIMALAARVAAVPGMVPRSEIFCAIEDLPDDPQPGTVGLIIDRGPAVAVVPEHERISPPPALFVLHPPGEPMAAAGYEQTASGVLLLPGVPHLGFEHQAIWVEVEPDGTLARLVTASGVNQFDDPDVAVLFSRIAA